jgi:Fic family protein
MAKEFKDILKETELSKDSRKFILAVMEEAGQSNKYKASELATMFHVSKRTIYYTLNNRK